MGTQKEQLLQGENISIFEINPQNFELFGVDLRMLTDDEVEQLIMAMRGKAVRGFVDARKEMLTAAKEWTNKKVIRFTTAPENYDSFGTVTVEWCGLQDSNGKPLRKVAVYLEHLQWQESRYGSGLHISFSEDRWGEFEDLFQSIG